MKARIQGKEFHSLPPHRPPDPVPLGLAALLRSPLIYLVGAIVILSMRKNSKTYLDRDLLSERIR
jgi:hypothetical protein